MAFDYAQALQEALSPINNLSAGTIALARQQGQDRTDLAKTRFLQESRALEAQKELEQHARIQKDYLQAADKIASDRERRAEQRLEEMEVRKKESIWGITPEKGASLEERSRAVDAAAREDTGNRLEHFTNEVKRQDTEAAKIIDGIHHRVKDVPPEVLAKAAKRVMADSTIAKNLTPSQRRVLESGKATDKDIGEILDNLKKTFWTSTGIANSSAFLSALNQQTDELLKGSREIDFRIASTQLQQIGQNRMDAVKTANDFIARTPGKISKELLQKLSPLNAGMDPVDTAPPRSQVGNETATGFSQPGQGGVAVPETTKAGSVTPVAAPSGGGFTGGYVGQALKSVAGGVASSLPVQLVGSAAADMVAQPAGLARKLFYNPNAPMPASATVNTWSDALAPLAQAAQTVSTPSVQSFAMRNVFAGMPPQGPSETPQVDPAHQNISSKMQSGQQLSDADIEAGTMATARDPQKLALAQKVFKTADVNQLANFGKILNRSAGSAGAAQLIKAAMDGDMSAQAKIDTITRGGGMQQTDYSNTAGAVGRAFNLQTPTFHAPDYGAQPANSF